MASERKFVAENVRRVLLKEYLMKEVSRAGFGGLDVQRTPLGTRVLLITERPGLVIGRRGQTIKNLTAAIEENYGFVNPQIEVQEVENANLNAQIMAEKLAFSLERGWHFRRAGHSTVRRVMDAGARGCHIIVAGKLTGQRHRTEKFKEGYIKFCGEPRVNFVERGYAVAKLKMGIIGVTVEIMRPDAKLPADTTIFTRTEAAALLPDIYGDNASIKSTVEEDIVAVEENIETIKGDVETVEEITKVVEETVEATKDVETVEEITKVVEETVEATKDIETVEVAEENKTSEDTPEQNEEVQ